LEVEEIMANVPEDSMFKLGHPAAARLALAVFIMRRDNREFEKKADNSKRRQRK